MPKHILVVDDDPTIRELLKDFLQDSGYQVSMAEDADAGVREAMAHKPDLILLDMQMPGGGGPSFVERLQKEESARMIPVFFVTGMSVGEVATLVPPSPQCLGYFHKPLQLALVSEKIAKVLS